MYFATRAFWTDLAERCVSTFWQTVAGYLTVAAFVPSLANYATAAKVAGAAALVAVAKAFGVGRGTTPAAQAVSYPPDLLERIATAPTTEDPTIAAATVPVGDDAATSTTPATLDVPASLASIGLV